MAIRTPKANAKLNAHGLLLQKLNPQVIALLSSDGSPTTYCPAESAESSETIGLAYAIFTGSLASATETLSLIAEYSSWERTIRDTSSSLLRYGRFSSKRPSDSADIPSSPICSTVAPFKSIRCWETSSSADRSE